MEAKQPTKEIAQILPPRPHVGRVARCICIVGKPGTGKSTLGVDLMCRAGCGLFVQPTPDDFTERMKRCNIEDRNSCDYLGVKYHIFRHDNDFNSIYRNFHEAFILFDDARVYIPANFEYSCVRDFLLRRRQKMLDVCFTAHGFSEIPPKLFTFITDYIIMNINDTPLCRKKDIRNPVIVEKLCRAVEQVKKQAQTNPHAKICVHIQ